MEITADIINGVCIGVEYVAGEDEDEYEHIVLLDLVVVRFVIEWGYKGEYEDE